MGEPETLRCTAPREAREWVRARLPALFGGLPRDVALDAELLASEMVMHVRRMGCEHVRVLLTHDEYAIRLDVTDGTGTCAPTPRPDAAVDYGLDIVHAASDEWGWRENGTGRSGLWAVLLTAPRSAAG